MCMGIVILNPAHRRLHLLMVMFVSIYGETDTCLGFRVDRGHIPLNPSFLIIRGPHSTLRNLSPALTEPILARLLGTVYKIVELR